MKFTVNNSTDVKTEASVKTVGHDDDQHEITLIGEDLAALKKVSELEEGQPSASTESFEGAKHPTGCDASERCNQRMPMCASRVIDVTTGAARISIVLGYPERTKWLATIIGLIDSASEKDVIDLTIDVCDSCNHAYGSRSLLSAIERCRATVITHAGVLTTLGDIALWLSGDTLRWSKHMTAIFVRQQFTGFMGDVRDFVSKADDATASFKEFRDYIAARGLFTKPELDNMYETRGMLSMFGRELEARVNALKQVE